MAREFPENWPMCGIRPGRRRPARVHPRESTGHLRRRSVAMARKKPADWGCGHPMPIEVVPFGEGRCARCLTCGQCGTARSESEGALRALLGSQGRREKMGAKSLHLPNFGLRGVPVAGAV